MKKTATKKKSVSPKTVGTSGTRTQKPLVTKEPQSKQKAALDAGMFLHTDDAWSESYFDKNDLHFKERELFG